jgi:hypothetical protein
MIPASLLSSLFSYGSRSIIGKKSNRPEDVEQMFSYDKFTGMQAESITP